MHTRIWIGKYQRCRPYFGKCPKKYDIQGTKSKPGEEDIAQKQWDIINQNLEGTGFKLSKFIRYHWLSKYGFLPESKLYEAIRKKLQVKEITIQSLLDDLVVDAERIKKLKSGSIDDYSQFNSPRRVYNSILGISSMNVSQVYVLLLSILRNKAMKKKWERDIEFLKNSASTIMQFQNYKQSELRKYTQNMRWKYSHCRNIG